MANLKGSRTEQNLKDAFAGESQANRRYLYFANKADVEGQNDVAALFRSTAEGETGHAHGHLEFLEAVGDPATGLPIGNSRQKLDQLKLDSVPLSQAISDLARQAGLEVTIDPALVKPGRDSEGRFASPPTVSIRWRNISAAQALAALLNAHGLKATREPGTGRYRIERASAPDSAPAKKDSPQP